MNLYMHSYVINKGIIRYKFELLNSSGNVRFVDAVWNET